MVYCCECAINYLNDAYDMESEAYEAAVLMFGNTIRVLAHSNNGLITRFTPRLKKLIAIAQKSDCGYGDDLQDMWNEIFESSKS